MADAIRHRGGTKETWTNKCRNTSTRGKKSYNSLTTLRKSSCGNSVQRIKVREWNRTWTEQKKTRQNVVSRVFTELRMSTWRPVEVARWQRWKATLRKTKVVCKGTEAKSGKVLTHAMTMNYGRGDQLVICTRLNHKREWTRNKRYIVVLPSQLLIVIVEVIVEFLSNAQVCQRDTDQVTLGVKCSTNGMVEHRYQGGKLDDWKQ